MMKNIVTRNDESDGDEDEIGLSPETLQALKEFALSSGIAIEANANDEVNKVKNNILSAVTSHFDIQDKYKTITAHFENNEYNITLSFKSIKRELGQTLSSTGLTIWTAAEHLCDFIFDNNGLFHNKTVCELGSGLGMVSILLAKMNKTKQLIVTDGDEVTMELLHENIQLSNCPPSSIIPMKLYWGEQESKEFKTLYPDGFDYLLAADVIYEREQILPLIITACTLLTGKDCR